LAELVKGPALVIGGGFLGLLDVGLGLDGLGLVGLGFLVDLGGKLVGIGVGGWGSHHDKYDIGNYASCPRWGSWFVILYPPKSLLWPFHNHNQKGEGKDWGDTQMDLLELIPCVYFMVEAKVAEKWVWVVSCI
jgi:hypothetical protein